MSYRTLNILRALTFWGMRVSLTGIGYSFVVLVAAAATARAQDPVALVQASKAIADQLPTDVVRLSLLVSVVSQVALLTFVFAQQKTMRYLLQKPCVLDAAAGKAVLREAVHEAADDVPRASGHARR